MDEKNVVVACTGCGDPYPGVEAGGELRPIGTDECTECGGTRFTKLDTNSS